MVGSPWNKRFHLVFFDNGVHRIEVSSIDIVVGWSESLSRRVDIGDGDVTSIRIVVCFMGSFQQIRMVNQDIYGGPNRCN